MAFAQHRRAVTTTLLLVDWNQGRRIGTAQPDLVPADVQPAQFFARMVDKLLNAAPIAHHVRVRERRERRTTPCRC